MFPPLVSEVGHSFFPIGREVPQKWDILLMEEILHHLGCIKPCKIMVQNYISTGAGILPSTVSVPPKPPHTANVQHVLHQPDNPSDLFAYLFCQKVKDATNPTVSPNIFFYQLSTHGLPIPPCEQWKNPGLGYIDDDIRPSYVGDYNKPL